MHQTGKLDVNGAKLYYEVRGEGHPLVLAHAGIADSRMWDDQMDAFAQRYQVIRYDFRGCGQSEIPPEPYALHDRIGARKPRAFKPGSRAPRAPPAPLSDGQRSMVDLRRPVRPTTIATAGRWPHR
jgi:pimeloyl-ACP methyl ester carboxylesterase